jgi:prefoldin beta subunit
MTQNEAHDKLGQLQLIEQNLQNFLMQKQNFQSQLIQIENAVEEIEKSTKKTAYKIVGPLMIESDVNSLKEDLKSKKEVLELRIKNIEKQEDKLKDKAKSVQEEVMKDLNKN